MKRIVIVFALLLAGYSGTAGSKSGMNAFYATHRGDTNAAHIAIPKFLMYLTDNDRETRKMLRYMRTLKIFQMDGLNEQRNTVNKELEQALKNDGFESMLSVNDEGERINIYILQDKRFIRKFLLTIDSSDELLVLQTRTKISFERLSALISDYKANKSKSGLKSLIKHKG